MPLLLLTAAAALSLPWWVGAAVIARWIVGGAP